MDQEDIHKQIMEAEDRAIMKSIDDAIFHFTQEKKVFSIKTGEEEG